MGVGPSPAPSVGAAALVAPPTATSGRAVVSVGSVTAAAGRAVVSVVSVRQVLAPCPAAAATMPIVAIAPSAARNPAAAALAAVDAPWAVAVAGAAVVIDQLLSGALDVPKEKFVVADRSVGWVILFVCAVELANVAETEA